MKSNPAITASRRPRSDSPPRPRRRGRRQHESFGDLTAISPCLLKWISTRPSSRQLSEVSNQVHAISQVFTGACYDMLADMFENYVTYQKYDPAETLFRLGKHMTSLVMLSPASGAEGKRNLPRRCGENDRDRAGRSLEAGDTTTFRGA